MSHPQAVPGGEISCFPSGMPLTVSVKVAGSTQRLTCPLYFSQALGLLLVHDNNTTNNSNNNSSALEV